MSQRATEVKEPFQTDLDDDCEQGGESGEPCCRNPEAGFGTSSCDDGGSGSKPDLHSSTMHLREASESLPRPL